MGNGRQRQAQGGRVGVGGDGALYRQRPVEVGRVSPEQIFSGALPGRIGIRRHDPPSGAVSAPATCPVNWYVSPAVMGSAAL